MLLVRMRASCAAELPRRRASGGLSSKVLPSSATAARAEANVHQGIKLTTEDRLFVLTGAGISAESGIATFRDSGGLWGRYRTDDVASPGGWARDPALVWRFYSERRRVAEAALPNAAHLALAQLEHELGERMLICTQNIDRLHEAAGTRRIVHVHGELFRSRCSSAQCASEPLEDHQRHEDATCLPHCATCGSLMRPAVVWFGEEPMLMSDVDDALGSCSVFVAIGTSGVVQPVSGFVKFLCARRPDCRTVYVGPERPDNAAFFGERRLGCAAAVVPGLFFCANAE